MFVTVTSLSLRDSDNTDINSHQLIQFYLHSQLSPHAVNGIELRKVLFLAPSVCGFLFVYEIYLEPLNGFAPNSRGRYASSLAWKSLKVKVKVQKLRSPETKTAFSALSAACVPFMFGTTPF